MEAFVIERPGKTGWAHLDPPTPAPHEVLLRIRVVGLCGTDLSTFRGRTPFLSYPRIPGHEIGATIEAVGTDVPDTLKPGKDVTVSPYTTCGTCTSCRQQRYNCCRENQTLGVQRDGAFAPYFVIPWDKVLHADGLSLPELALVEPLSVGFHAVARGRVTAQDTVVVLGCGMIGLGVIAGAAQQGARIIAVDLDDQKLAVARKAGATAGINTKTEDLHERLQALTDGHGPDVIVEAIGLPETFRAAVEEVSFAGRVVYIGYAKAPVTYDTVLFVRKELDILGSRNALPADFERVMAMLPTGSFPVQDVITKTVPFHEAGNALQAWDERPEAFTKIQVSLDG